MAKKFSKIKNTLEGISAPNELSAAMLNESEAVLIEIERLLQVNPDYTKKVEGEEEYFVLDKLIELLKYFVDKPVRYPVRKVKQ